MTIILGNSLLVNYGMNKTEIKLEIPRVGSTRCLLLELPHFSHCNWFSISLRERITQSYHYPGLSQLTPTIINSLEKTSPSGLSSYLTVSQVYYKRFTGQFCVYLGGSVVDVCKWSCL